MISRRRAVIVGIILLALAAAISASAGPDWESRPGSIEHALLQPDGTSVYLDAVCTDKMKARQEPSYFVVRENSNYHSRIIVYATPPTVLRAGHTIDVEGVLGTLSNGERMISSPRILGYLDRNGQLLKHMPMKGYLAPTPWESKVELPVPAEMQSLMKASGFPEIPIRDPQDPAVYYSGVADLLAANSASAVDGKGVGLECLSVISVGSDPDFGNYIVIRSDSGPHTMKAFYSFAVDAGNRINHVTGQIRAMGSEVVICIDSGPDYDPQGFLGGMIAAAPGSIAYARTLSDSSQVTVQGLVVVAGTGDLQDGLSVQDRALSVAMRVAHSGSRQINRGDVVDVTGVISTNMNGEREILVGDEGISVVSSSGPVPAYVGMNNRMFGGGAVNSRTPGVNTPADGFGIPNIGMLSRTWGRVTGVDVGARVMFIDDGSNLSNGSGSPIGLKVTWDAEGGTVSTPAVGDFLTHVIGISAMEDVGLNQRARVLRIRKIAAPAVTVQLLSSAVELSWTPQDNTIYRVYRSQNQDGPFGLVDSVAGGLYHDANVVSGNTYFYRVSGVVAEIEGGSSHLVSATPGSSPGLIVFPSVQLTSFDNSTYEYSYTVTAPANMTYSFGWLQVDALVPDAAPNGPWSILGPYVDGVDMAWKNTSALYDPVSGATSARWDAITRGQLVNPGTAWVGVFKLIAPNTQPVPGYAATKDAVAASWNVSEVLVPGYLPPPPADSMPPITTISLAGEFQNGWFRGDVTVTLTAEDNSSGVALTEYQIGDGDDWLEYIEPFTMNQDGVFTVYARSIDNAHNQEEPPAEREVKIDNAAPSTLISLAGAMQNGWYTSTVVVTLSASDVGSGVEATEFSINGGPWIPYTGPQALAQDGAYHIVARSTDVAGNVETPASGSIFVIDSQAPVTSISVTGDQEDGWYTSEALITITAHDLGSGVGGTEYQLNDGAWVVYQGPFAVSEGGTITVSARSIDNAGNVENPPVQQEIAIDGTAPVTTIIVTGDETNGWYTGEVTVTLTAVDAESGVASTEYTMDDDAWVQYDGELTLGEDGIVTLQARSKDKANNLEDPAVQQEIKIDTQLPELAIVDLPSAGCHLVKKDALDVVFRATDSGSGLDGLPTATLTFSPDDPLLASPSVTELTVTPVEGQEDTYRIHTAPQVPGTYTFTLTATDKAGHSASFSSGLAFVVGAYEVEWLEPISLMEVFVMQDGSTVPVKFRLKDPCNNNAYVNTADYRITVTKDDDDDNPDNDVVYAGNLIPKSESDHYHVNVSTKVPSLWPVGLYTVTISGPGIWDVYSGPYKSKYGVDIQDGSLAKGVGRKK